MSLPYFINKQGLIICLIFFFSSAVYAEKLVVYTVNYPLQYFAQRIAGDFVSVHFPAPMKIDPAFWMPDAKTINQYQQADLILLNGADYAKWVKKVSLPRTRMVNTSKGFKGKYISIKNTVNHQHGPGGEHSHAGIAFTTWLDFKQATEQANAILNALIRKQPQYEQTFIENFRALEKDLLGLDNQLSQIIVKDLSKTFLASHPIYQYFSRRYQLNLNELMWEPDEYPSQVEWAVLAQLLEQDSTKWMLWEDQPDSRTMKRLSELGLSIIVFKPCMNSPEQGDFLSEMQANIRNVVQALQENENY